MKPRLVCWYSHGAASLVAAKKAIEMAPDLYPGHEVVVANIYIKNEYQEPERLVKVERYLGVNLTTLQDEKYGACVDTVVQKTRYMSGVYGARCTKVLKKEVRQRWQRFDDVHVFGMTVEEKKRIGRILDGEPDLDIFAPHIDLGLTKVDCFNEMTAAGLELPMMYKLGFHNNNCIGCLKAAGAGYWNKIRRVFPGVFNLRAHQEYLLGVALVTMSENKFLSDYPDYALRMQEDGAYRVKVNNRKVYRVNKDTKKREWSGEMREERVLFVPLRYLPPDAGSHKDLDIGDCGFVCEMK